MAKKQFKKYGRVNTNKLDWLLAFAFAGIALASLWISIGISFADAAEAARGAFMDFFRGLGFVLNAAQNGQSAVASAFVTVIFYESLLLLILGTLWLVKRGLKDRVPGLVAQFVAFIGFAMFVCFSFEFLGGNGKGAVHAFWPISLIVFTVALFCLGVIAIYVTFNLKYNIELAKKGEEQQEQPQEEPVQEEEKEEEPQKEEQPAEEESQEEPAEEPEPEEEAAPEEEQEEELEEEAEGEDEEELAEGEEGEEGFAGLGARRKRVPFENKIKRAKPEVRERYKEIVANLRQYDFNDRKSIPGETFSYKRQKHIFITISGSTLKVFFNLNPKDYAESPIPVQDVSDIKKYEDTPLYLKVKSNLAVKRVAILAQKIIEDNQIEKK